MIDVDLKKLKAAITVLRSIHHPVRKIMLALIDETLGITVKQIYGTMRLEQSVASLHLAVLRKSGIVRTERAGNSIRYYIDDNIKAISSLANQLSGYFK